MNCLETKPTGRWKPILEILYA